MKNLLDFDHKKATQALNYFAQQEGGEINYMKAIKLLYLAERYHLRKYGRLIIHDQYWAMAKGPVPSASLNIAKADDDYLDDVEKIYVKSLLKTDLGNKTIQSLANIDESVFSESDLEALSFSYQGYGKNDQWGLVKLTHEYPEWAKFEDDFNVQKDRPTRIEMDYMDFFNNPSNFNTQSFGSDKFVQDDEEINNSKEIFKQSMEVAKILQ